MLQYVCVRTIGVLSLFIDNAAGCFCQNDRCVVIVPRLCCSMFVHQNIGNVVIVHRQCCRIVYEQ